MIRVWSDGRHAGVLDRLQRRGSTFAYDPRAEAARAVSLTMPVRIKSWDSAFQLLPIFQMNLPEGALRERLLRQFAKATGSFDDLDLLGVVGRTQIGRLRYSGLQSDLAEDVPFQSSISVRYIITRAYRAARRRILTKDGVAAGRPQRHD